jgi:hypothetical protein
LTVKKQKGNNLNNMNAYEFAVKELERAQKNLEYAKSKRNSNQVEIKNLEEKVRLRKEVEETMRSKFNAK